MKGGLLVKKKVKKKGPKKSLSKPLPIRRLETVMIQPNETERINWLKNVNCVAMVDLLGTTEKTTKVDFEQLRQGNDLATIWWFIAHLCKIDPELKVSGISDSLVLARWDFTKLLPMLVALFQISFLTRGFRVRAGIEIGNAYGVDSFHHDLSPFIKEHNLTNLVIPQY